MALLVVLDCTTEIQNEAPKFNLLTAFYCQISFGAQTYSIFIMCPSEVFLTEQFLHIIYVKMKFSLQNNSIICNICKISTYKYFKV